MSVRDIIEAATLGVWSVDRDDWRVWSSNTVLAECQHHGSQDYANAAFIATFDPEHVALMEAVVEGVKLTTTPNTGKSVALVQPAALRALDALTAYRRERGLS